MVREGLRFLRHFMQAEAVTPVMVLYTHTQAAVLLDSDSLRVVAPEVKSLLKRLKSVTTNLWGNLMRAVPQAEVASDNAKGVTQVLFHSGREVLPVILQA